MAKTKKMAFGGMGNMATRGGKLAPPPAPLRGAQPPPSQPRPQVSLPPRPAAPQQTFGERMAARMAEQKSQTPPPMVQAAAQQAIAQSQRAQQNMAPGTGGRGTQQYEARRQQQAMPSGQGLGRGMAPPSQMLQASGPTPPPMPQRGMQTQTMPGGGLPSANLGGMGATGPGTQTGGPATMGMAPPNAAKVGMFKKGGKVCYADGGKAEEKKEPPIPAETLASMKRQAAQEKADRQQAKEQKAGEKEVRDNMGRIGFKKGGSIKVSKMGAVKVSKPTMRSASSRADGIAIRGKTRA